MLLPHVKADNSNNFTKSLLQGATLPVVLVGSVQRALNDNRVEVGEDFVFLKDHRARPRAVVDCKVEHPFVGCSLPHIAQELFQILLVFKNVLVKVGHFSYTHNLAALLQKDRNANVLRKGHQGVEVAQDLLIRSLLIKLFEVLPVALKRTSFHTFWQI